MSITRCDRIPFSVAGFGDTLTHDLARSVPAALTFFPTQSPSDVMQRIAARAYPRAELRRILESSAQRLQAPAPALENIRRLAEPNSFVVATGQQAGFLGGPLYSLHKALSTIALARRYEAESNGAARFVPVFWVAGDDHDLAEIDHADILRADGTLARAKAEIAVECHGHSACHAFLNKSPEHLAALREQLSTAASAEVVDEWLALYREHNFGDAFGVLMYRWLGELGLVIAPSADLRPLAAPLLARELDDFEITSRLIQEAAVAMNRAGYSPGFSDKARVAPHFFVEAEPTRVRASLEPLRDGDTIHFRERSPSLQGRGRDPKTFSKSELKTLLAEKPHLFSAAAALRAVLQQDIFPVVAAILGPGEIAYWAQVKTVHDHFNVPWPIVVPRASATLIDGAGEKALRKLGLTANAPELFADAATLSAKAGAGGGLDAIAKSRTEKILTEFDALAAEISAVDGGLGPLFGKTRERFAHELERIAEKIRASAEQRDGARHGRVQYLSSLIRPKSSPQERVLTTGPWLAKYPNLAADLLEAMDPLASEHAIVTL